MTRFGIFLRIHARTVAVVTASLTALTVVVAYKAAEDAPAAADPPPVVVTAEPAPTVAHYSGRHGDDDGHGEVWWTPGPTTTADPAAAATAYEFTRAWARPELTAGAWLDGVDEYATHDYVRSLADIDPARVPASRVTGAPRAVESRTDRARIDVPTDGGTLRVTLVSLVGKWWVTHTEWLDTA